MKRLKKILLWAAGTLIVLALAALTFYLTQKTHHKAGGTPAAVKPSGDPTLDAIRRGVEFLIVHQEADGEFSAGALDPKPAFTAMVVDALVRSPDRHDEHNPVIGQAVRAILSHQQPDGGIYTPKLGMGNYCTSVSVMALSRLNNPAYEPVIKEARAYILGVQQTDGGMGYNPSSRSDLSNTSMALDALRAAGLSEKDEAFQRAAAFVALCQNNAETNQAEYAKVVNDGGFMYRPGESKAGQVQGRDGQVGFKSYGLMSYAGLVSFLWAGVDREDARVKSAYRWVEENWNLEENVNLKDAGLYYYYLTMAKALQVYGRREIKGKDGAVHDWPKELAAKIASLQKPDGSWSNRNDKWFEQDPVLVTAYMVRALSICHEAANAPTRH
ncbi:MAG TPA: terpene cyclase/mutase family protein [Planctomycetota bacterium]|nr:terpene cyclase/mutase family protein [Planctomycetota bacterium]